MKAQEIAEIIARCDPNAEVYLDITNKAVLADDLPETVYRATFVYAVRAPNGNAVTIAINATTDNSI